MRLIKILSLMGCLVLAGCAATSAASYHSVENLHVGMSPKSVHAVINANPKDVFSVNVDGKRVTVYAYNLELGASVNDYFFIFDSHNRLYYWGTSVELARADRNFIRKIGDKASMRLLGAQPQ